MMTMIRSILLSISLIALLVAPSRATDAASLVDIVDKKNDNNNAHVELVAPPRSSLRAGLSCPTGPDYRYLSRNSTCTVMYRCVPGRMPFKIAGCGCGCRIAAVNVTQPVAKPVAKPVATPTTTKAPVKPPTTCPSGPDVVYRTRNSSCTLNFVCSAGNAPFRIVGCGCGCHKVKATPPPTTAPVACPSGPDYRYQSRAPNCINNYLCVIGRVPFKIPGCGCGCRTNTTVITNPTAKPIATPTKPIASPTKPIAASTKPVAKPIAAPVKRPTLPAPTKAPISVVPSTCPSNSDIVYRSRNTSCVVNFLCVKGLEPIKVPGCGCGCHKATTSSNTKTCPTGTGFTYINSNSNCVVNFLCVQGKTSFKIPGCGCGCRTVAPTPPTRAPVATTTLAPGIKFNKPTSNPV